MPANIIVGNTYAFTLVNNVFIDPNQTGKVLSICDFSIARLLMDVGQMHINIRPYLSGETNQTSDPSQLTYYVIETTGGNKVVIADLWVTNVASATVLTNTYSITFDTVSRVQEFEQLMIDYGFNVSRISAPSGQIQPAQAAAG